MISRFRNTLLINVLWVLIIVMAGCTQEGREQVGNAYNSSLTSNVTKKWVARVSNNEACIHFKNELIEESKKYNSAASGAYVNGMRSIIDRAISNGCAK